MTYPHSEQRKVLVIDDDPAVVATLADGLELVGDYEVIIASDGAEGLRLLRARQSQPGNSSRRRFRSHSSRPVRNASRCLLTHRPSANAPS